MSKNLAGLIQILGAGAVGYMQGKKLEAKDAEAKADRESERAFLTEQRGRERQGWAEQDSMKQALKDSQADIVIEEVPGIDPNYNVASMTGEREPGSPAPAPAGFKVGARSFGDRGAAQQALHGVNSRAAKYERTAKALAEQGQIDKARQYDEFAKSAISEGTDQILGAISATAPKVEDVKKAGGMVAGTIGAQAAEIFNKTGGKWNVSADTVIQHFVDKDAAGREFVNSRVLGKDGKPVVEDVRAAGMMLADFKTRLAQQNQDTQTYQTGQQQAETARHNKVGEQQNAEEHRSLRADRAATRSIQQQRLEMERGQFRKQTPAGQIEALEEAAGVKLTAEEKKSFLGITKKTGGAGGDEAAKATNKLVDSLTEKFAEVNQDPAAVVQYRASLHKMIGAQKNNSEVEGVLKAEFGKHTPDSPGYAATYAEAKTALGMTDAALAALGYKAPKAAPARMAAQGTGRIPSPPPQKIWVGNSHQTNPAYTQWEQQYGGTVRKQEASENARLVNAYERVRN